MIIPLNATDFNLNEHVAVNEFVAYVQATAHARFVCNYRSNLLVIVNCDL